MKQVLQLYQVAHTTVLMVRTSILATLATGGLLAKAMPRAHGTEAGPSATTPLEWAGVLTTSGLVSQFAASEIIDLRKFG